MAVERIKNAVLGSATKEAERIKEAGRKKADERHRKTAHDLQRQFDERLEGARRVAEAKKNRALIALRGSLGMQLLEEKNRVIDNLFDQAVEKVVAGDNYKALLAKWLDTSAPEGLCKLALNERDAKAFGKELVDQINKSRKDAIKLAEKPVNIRGGFIILTEKYEIDRTLESTATNLKVEDGPKIANELFGDRVERVEAS